MLYTGIFTVRQGRGLHSARPGWRLLTRHSRSCRSLSRPVRPSETLDYSLALPRTDCYFVTSHPDLSPSPSSASAGVWGWAWCSCSSRRCSATRKLNSARAPSDAGTRDPPLVRSLRGLLDGLLIFVRSPRLLVLAGLAALANFVMYPAVLARPASMAAGTEAAQALAG